LSTNTTNVGYLYILQSCLNSSYYIGSTIDLEKRLSEHNNGYVKSTKNLRPMELRFYKKYETILEARRIEYKLKKMKNRKIIERIILEQEIKITV
jgi:putative endonuclease